MTNRPAPTSEPDAFDDAPEHLSEIDRRIVKLNHEDLSNKEISIRLAEEGIILSKSSVTRHLAELRQVPDNDIQINYECTIQQPPRQENKWYKVIERLAVNLETYQKTMGFKASSRTMYYQLLDEKILDKDKKYEHRDFVEATRKARLEWVDSNGELMYPKLDIDCFADDTSRVERNFRRGWVKPQEPTDPGGIEDPIEYVEAQIKSLKASIYRYSGVGTRGQPGQIGHRWYGQSEYVEVWEEKTDLIPAFEKILDGMEVNIKAGKGYPSLTFLKKCCDELKERIEKYGFKPENIHILYCGDLDPSGENIDWYIQKRFKQLGIEGIHFERIAVTAEQIEKYNLPTEIVERKPDKKAPNPNMNEFIRRYGNRATHLNAFFTPEHLGAFTEILRQAVDNEYFDEEIYDEMVDGYDVEAEEPEKMSEEELIDAKIEMCKRVSEMFGKGWASGIVGEGYDDSEDDDEDSEE